MGFNWIWSLVPHTPMPEIVMRGSLVYLVLFGLLRFIPKREAGAAGVTDLLVVVLIADAAQNAMADSYTSVSDGVILVLTIVFWAWALNWLSFHVAWIGKIISPPALLLVRDGRLIRRNMQRELITEEELMAQMRLQGIEDLAEVREARIEADGRVSVIPHGAPKSAGAPERKSA